MEVKEAEEHLNKDQLQHMQHQMTHQNPTLYYHNQNTKAKHDQEDQTISLVNPFLSTQFFYNYSKQLAHPEYQYGVIATIKIFYQIVATISEY